MLTLRILRILMHLSSGHVTLLWGNFNSLNLFHTSDLQHQAASHCALPHISSFFYVTNISLVMFIHLSILLAKICSYNLQMNVFFSVV